MLGYHRLHICYTVGVGLLYKKQYDMLCSECCFTFIKNRLYTSKNYVIYFVSLKVYRVTRTTVLVCTSVGCYKTPPFCSLSRHDVAHWWWAELGGETLHGIEYKWNGIMRPGCLGNGLPRWGGGAYQGAGENNEHNRRVLVHGLNASEATQM